MQAVDTGYWQWKSVIACAWGADHEHISALETRSYLLTLKWRLRSPAGLSKRFLHLVDSQTAFGALVKHRSGSPLLQYLVRRGVAMERAGNLSPTLVFCHSHRNPADHPSRLLGKRKPDQTTQSPTNWQKARKGAVDQ